MTDPIRIGTRKSELALWQAHNVHGLLRGLGRKAVIKPTVSTGDLVLDKPLYALGITGIFTRTLDTALLAGEIDIAVHSLKDVPTLMPKGLVEAAVLKRANARDILVHKNDQDILSKSGAVIATGSLRRRAAWLHKYPHHKLVGLRGNVNSRLQKLKDNNWNGAIFAAAGLERIGILPDNHSVLNWMVPAPAQGAILIMCREDDLKVLEICRQLNDEHTSLCTKIEREFLNKLEGGCTAPIGAYAYIKDGNVHFEGVLYSRDGQTKIDVTRVTSLKDSQNIADDCIQEIVAKGGREVMNENALRAEQDENTAMPAEQVHVFSTKILSTEQTQNLGQKFIYKEANFIDVEFCQLTPEQANAKNVIFTSQNGVNAVHKNLAQNEMPFERIFCVGDRTKALAEQLFGPQLFDSGVHVENSALALAKHIVDNHRGLDFTFFCGDKRLDVLPDYLRKNQVSHKEVIVYKTHYKSAPVTGKVDCVLFFSPSAVKSYLKENKPDPIAFCIGQTTAMEANKHFKRVETAPSPIVRNVVELVNKYYE
ncbi:MAG: hydroxymethylbilane synthase [Robiginitomaculum sp.]|nr:MAG: hydroxymethylbilane synthase [Robiginitomaculum sp.]